jgi:hypothetical protein
VTGIKLRLKCRQVDDSLCYNTLKLSLVWLCPPLSPPTTIFCASFKKPIAYCGKNPWKPIASFGKPIARSKNWANGVGKLQDETEPGYRVSSLNSYLNLPTPGKQIGGLGAKFGSFTEGLALPSMETILQQRFGMTVVMPRVRAKRNGEHLEIDVLAYANGDITSSLARSSLTLPRLFDSVVSLLSRQSAAGGIVAMIKYPAWA